MTTSAAVVSDFILLPFSRRTSNGATVTRVQEHENKANHDRGSDQEYIGERDTIVALLLVAEVLIIRLPETQRPPSQS